MLSSEGGCRVKNNNKLILSGFQISVLIHIVYMPTQSGYVVYLWNFYE